MIIKDFGKFRAVIYTSDHPPPHIHILTTEGAAQVEIATGKVMEGRIPWGEGRQIRDWVEENRADLLETFYDLNPQLPR